MTEQQAKERAQQLTQQAHDLLELAVATGHAHPDAERALLGTTGALLEKDSTQTRGYEGQFITQKG